MKTSRFYRAISFCLCTALCAVSFSGCSFKNSSPESLLNPKSPTTIQVWTYYNGPQKLAFDALVLEFNDTLGKELGIAVEAVSNSNVNELTQAVLDAANKKVGASDIPQVFAAYADTAYQIDQMGLVASLDSYLTQKELAEFVPGYLEEGRLSSDGMLKIFPVAKSTEILMLNKTDWDKFSAATGAELATLSTMEGVAKVAAQYYTWTDSLTPEPNDGKAFFGRDAVANYFIVGCKQLGVEIFTVKDGVVTITADKAALRRLWDCFYVPFLQGHYAANGRFRSEDVKTGDCIAIVCSTSGAAYFPNEVNLSDTEGYPIEVVAMPAPVFEGGKPVAVQQGAGMVVTKSTPVQEYASVVFLKWLTEAERNIRFATLTGYLPVKTAANDTALLDAALSELPPSALAENLSITLPVAVEQVKSSELYTNKAFQNGTPARAVLEESLMNRITADLVSLEQFVANGTPRDVALAGFLSDKSFEGWYAAFTDELNTVVGQQ